jgi:signal transduction histidine kinase
VALTSPLSLGLIGFRVGVWLFSYTLFFTTLTAGGATRSDTPLYLVMLALVGMALSGATETSVNRTRAVTMSIRFLIVSFVVVAVTCVNAAIDVATLGRSLAPSAAHDLRFFLLNGIASFTFLIWIHAFYAACVWLVGASLDLVDKEKRLAEAETQAQRATLLALRSQVNPHFLFNALNAAASLVATRRNEQAEELIVRLSEFFRTSLGSDRPATITLREEFDTLDAYLQIELVRFSGRLEVTMECPPRLVSAGVPSFLLLPLVENAIKHAVAHSTVPVQLHISAAGGDGRVILTVEDEAMEKASPISSQGEGVGLANVRQRLNVLYGAAATFEAGPTQRGFCVRIEMPLTACEGA